MEVKAPEYVNKVLNTLAAGGYSSCVVGGCVRDMLLGREPNDWDIATAALPEQVMDMFPKCIPTGLKHGTVTVRMDGQNVEVTTFRTEGGYADHRHPDSVSFVTDMNEDLSRRDFTVNAMAVTPDGELADPFCGLKDLESGLIRCVGSPEERFNEDALRMFRAFRFSSRFGFEIEENTYNAINKCAPLAASLSAERVRDEIEKIILTASPEYFIALADCGLMDKYLTMHPKNAGRMKLAAGLPENRTVRWAALCRLLTEEGCILSARDFLRALRQDGELIRCCDACLSIMDAGIPGDNPGWKQALRMYGETAAMCAAQCSDGLNGTNYVNLLQQVLDSGECFSIAMLAVSGGDLMELGYSGRELGAGLNALLDHVIERPEDNTRDILMGLAEEGHA